MNSVIQYSNQYLISKSDIQIPFDNWKCNSIGNAYLYTAPNLSVYSNEAVTLLGFATHVLHPDWDEQQIIEAFPDKYEDQLDYIDHLCGIHLIIVNGHILYNDAAGVMKMFTFTEQQSIKAVASDPKILSEIFDLKRNESSEAKEFYNTEFFQKTCIRLGKLTQFEQVEQVLPNHSLDLNNDKVERYFPREKKANISLEKALDDVHLYFSNVMAALHRKYQIKCSMTAGWDSRMVLAMTKEIHPDVQYYTFMLPFFNPKHEDVKIPTRMSTELGLRHEFVSKEIQLDDSSLKAIRSSFTLMEYEKVGTYFGGFPKYRSGDNVLLLGTVSEICKNYYDNVDISDGNSFAKAAHFPVIPYTTSYLDEKLNELKELEKRFGYDLRDIAHWEQDITNFAAKRTFYLYSFVRAFSPFNSRIILTTILSTPRELRDKQEHEFYRLYLEKFYPKLLEFPVNPSLKQKLIRLGKKAGIYGAYKKLSTKLRK